jgi:hypothetical protein
MKAPINLLDTVSEDPSNVYIRHIVKSALHHAMTFKDMLETEAESFWLELGFQLDKWA